jgi:NAD(P)-dependent dehydrogenase (short-subunit alcohol dehydrogenase family)
VRINVSSTPAIFGYTEGALFSIANAELIATTKHIALDNRDNNIQAITIALGDIFTQARFSSRSLLKAERRRRRT